MIGEFYTELADAVTYELDACIGCHLCMRACPLPESNTLQIGELNDAAAGGPLSERVLRFTLDCTQCGACVPVCPADISRMRLVFATKLRLDPPPEDTPVYVHAGSPSVPSGWTHGSLATALAWLPLFSEVTQNQLRSFVPRVSLAQQPPGAVLVHEGEYSNALSVLISGAADARTTTADGHQVSLLRLGPGNFFGEFGILSDRPNPATVITTVETWVLTATAAALHRLMAEAPAFAERLAALHARFEMRAYLARTEVLQDLSEEALTWLSYRPEVRTYERGAVIARAGSAATALHLVLTGFVKVSARAANRDERVVTYVRDGDTFVDGALFNMQPRRTTLVANTRCELVVVNRPDVEAMRAAYPLFRDRLAATGRAHAELTARALGPTALPGEEHLETLLDGGVLQSHSLLVVDGRLCIHCNNCIDACVRRHGHPRFERRGLTVGPYLIATACRHCDDPLCLLCPVDGIVRNPDGTIVINNNCIGCGACAERCPYDNIRMADVQQLLAAEKAESSLWSRLKNFARPREMGAVTFDQDDLRPKVAVKCDLCASHKDGPACVRNCPTGAAFRADGARFFGTGEVIAVTPSAGRSARG
jgi:Fe-S-cluster-containing hydrogenase component 2/CRP-like cAMP-binding protein